MFFLEPVEKVKKFWISPVDKFMCYSRTVKKSLGKVMIMEEMMTSKCSMSVKHMLVQHVEAWRKGNFALRYH